MANRLFDICLSSALFIVSIPILTALFTIIHLSSKGPFIFKQKRLGKNKKAFTIYKIRTMVDNAESLKTKYLQLNEVDGPVFKIRDDPRYTKIGKWIARYGLDELPQLINVLKGDMALVGPRPLPVDEAKKIPWKYSLRFSVLPGITSPWVAQGAHKLTFKEWMESDIEYIKNKSTAYDFIIILKTIYILFPAISFNHPDDK